MSLKHRLARLEREHGRKCGVNGIAPLEVLVAMLQEQERQAVAAFVPTLEDLVAQLEREEREHNHPAERVLWPENEYPENAP